MSERSRAGTIVRARRDSARVVIRNRVGCVLQLGLMLAPVLQAADAADLWAGVWVRDAVRSTCDPGPCPKTEASTVTKWAEGVTILLETEAADGSKSSQMVRLRFDGKEYPAFDARGKPTGAQWAIYQTGERTFERLIRNGDKVTANKAYVFSEDGKTRVTTLVGVTSDGRPRKNVTYWIRR